MIMKYTNKRILVKTRDRYLQEYQTKSTDHVEMEALLSSGRVYKKIIE